MFITMSCFLLDDIHRDYYADARHAARSLRRRCHVQRAAAMREKRCCGARSDASACSRVQQSGAQQHANTRRAGDARMPLPSALLRHFQLHV